MRITKEDIQRQLDGLESGVPYRLKVNRQLTLMVSILVTGNSIAIEVNPTRIRTEAQLRHVVSFCARQLFWPWVPGAANRADGVDRKGQRELVSQGVRA